VHAVQEFGGDGIARSGADHGVDCAFRTFSGLALINPFRDVRRGEDRKAVKAAAKRTVLQFHSMETAVLVSRLQAISIRLGLSQPKLDHAPQFTAFCLLRPNHRLHVLYRLVMYGWARLDRNLKIDCNRRRVHRVFLSPTPSEDF
jgi:hypothetical protein